MTTADWLWTGVIAVVAVVALVEFFPDVYDSWQCCRRDRERRRNG